jgi:hypothetical protein
VLLPQALVVGESAFVAETKGILSTAFTREFIQIWRRLIIRPASPFRIQSGLKAAAIAFLIAPEVPTARVVVCFLSGP